MLNTTGVLTVMDHGVTINWDDGPTLHHMTALVRYHAEDDSEVQEVRVQAVQPKRDEDAVDEEPEQTGWSFVQEDVIRATWNWEAVPVPGSAAAADAASLAESTAYWTAQLTVANKGENLVYLDSLDVIDVDVRYAGQFNLGAPVGLWRYAQERPGAGHTGREPGWTAWQEGTPGTGTFTCERELLVQPRESNRTHPPAVIIHAGDGSAEAGTAAPELPIEIRLEARGGRFQHLVAGCRTGGRLLQAGEALASPRFLIAAGDDAVELLELAAGAR